MKYLKITTAIVVLVGIVFGVYLFVSFQKKLYNTMVLHDARIMTLFKFVNTNFPEQVKIYDDEVTKRLEALPTNTVQK